MTAVLIIGNLGFVVSALSLLMRDMLLLRLLSIAAGGLAIAYYIIVPGGPIWLSAGWNMFFLGINLLQVVLLFRERRAARFSDEEAELHQVLFPALNPVQFLKLLQIAEWRDEAAGSLLATEGQEVRDIMLIVHGEAEARRGGAAVRVLGDGALIGEIAYVSGRPFSADIRLTQPSRLLVWRKSQLDGLVARNPLIGMAMASALILGLEPAPARRVLGIGGPGPAA